MSVRSDAITENLFKTIRDALVDCVSEGFKEVEK